MEDYKYEIGELVYAAVDILNDGGMPGIDDEEGLIAPAGMRGMLIQCGYAEVDETQHVYLVRFENGPDGTLGDPVGCLPEELTQEQAVPA
ncbi:MAG: nitrogen fixation protein NifZ [Dechloromonas sp.]|nr:nitrogen fixation protein NifZ [Dechloromonas sp.]